MKEMGYDVAIVGIGNWAQRAIIPTLQDTNHFKQLNRIHLAARSNYTTLLHRYQNNKTIEIYRHTDLRLLLSDDSIRAVIVATPFEEHYGLVKQSLMAHKHVFVEKPFVENTDEAKELFSLAHHRGLELMVGYEFLYDLRFLQLRQILQDGTLGKIKEVKISLLNRKIDIASHQNISVVNHLVMHQLSILKCLFPEETLSEIEVISAEEKYIEIDCRLNEIKVFLESGKDYFENENFRFLTVLGELKSIHLDFNGTEASATLESVDDREAGPIVIENNLGKIEKPPVQAEFESFFKRIEQPTIDPDYAKAMISFVEISHKLIQQHKAVTKLQNDKSEASKGALYDSISKQVFLLQKPDAEPDLDFLPNRYVEIAHKVEKVIHILTSKPNISAETIVSNTDLSKNDLRVVYRLIRGSDASFERFNYSDFSDYFNLASKFIAQRGFQLTFFVGRNCPYRCDFCPSVSENLDGTRNLALYPYKKNELLKKKEICHALDILEDFQRAGRPVSINISGGLEPLNDMARVRFILTEAAYRGIETTLYTNGFFFNNDLAREIALKSSRTRISLNAANAKRFEENVGRPSSNFDFLLQGLRLLVRDRKQINSKTHISLHAVVTPSIIDDIPKLALLAHELGLDSVSYNPDYEASYTEVEGYKIRKHITSINNEIGSGRLGMLKLMYGGSLIRCNIFPMDYKNYDLAPISNYKMFVDPAGMVTPIHEAGYPRGKSTAEAFSTPYRLGRLGKNNLLDILSKRHQLPRRDLKEMNGFEMIVASELTRLKNDREFGFIREENPYWRDSNIHSFPRELMDLIRRRYSQ